jgi:RimJ/RimL family protein N-acetyltransferase
MIDLTPFTEVNFDQLIRWVDTEELLVQIAGTTWAYPLTEEQLQRYVKSTHAFNVVETHSGRLIGHAEIMPQASGVYKLDKVLIGDKADRGRGYGLPLMKALIQYAFGQLNAGKVELNVYDWNTPAIRLYEKAGFTAHREKTMQTVVGGETWTAFNMTIDRTPLPG